MNFSIDTVERKTYRTGMAMLTTTDLAKRGWRIPSFQCAFLGGSRAIVDPAPTDTDEDICVHVSDIDSAQYYLETLGFDTPEGDYEGESKTFITLRKGDVNFLLFEEDYEFGAVWGATSYARSVNMSSKADRYDLFERVRLPWRNQE